jgi:hypothetical protein
MRSFSATGVLLNLSNRQSSGWADSEQSIMNIDFGRRGPRLVAAALLGGAMALVPAASSAVAQTTGTLYVWIDGWGSGTVTSNPGGINCRLVSPPGFPYEHESRQDQVLSGSCHASFPVGTVVTVTAAPDAGNYLNGLDCGGPFTPGSSCQRTVTSGYNAAWSMFCPDGGLCSAG